MNRLGEACRSTENYPRSCLQASLPARMPSSTTRSWFSSLTSHFLLFEFPLPSTCWYFQKSLPLALTFPPGIGTPLLDICSWEVLRPLKLNYPRLNPLHLLSSCVSHPSWMMPQCSQFIPSFVHPFKHLLLTHLLTHSFKYVLSTCYVPNAFLELGNTAVTLF